jgi:hypothetical protein
MIEAYKNFPFLKLKIMKTSNKIFLVAISVLGLSMLSILIFAKSSLINYEQSKVQGNGKIIKMDYPIEDVALLEVDEFFEVYVTVGEPKLEIETDENIQALLRASSDNYHRNNSDEAYKRVLNVEKMTNVNISPTQAIKLFLAVPTLERVELNNHASIVFEEVMTSEKFELEADEFSTAELKLNTQNLNINANNHATINIEGNIGETKIEADEFATLDIKNIEAKTVNLNLRNHVQVKLAGNTQLLSLTTNEFCEVDGSNIMATRGDIKSGNHSDISLYVTETLDVKGGEFSSIKYRGNPTINKYLDKTSTLTAME